MSPAVTAFTIVTIEPEGYVHSRAFDEIRLLLYHSLCDLGHRVSLRTNRLHDGGQIILLGAHLLPDEELASLPPDAIVFNTEQLQGDYGPWAARILRLAERQRIWDYASANIRHLNDHLGDGASLNRLRLGHHPRLEKFGRRSDAERVFVFFGSITPYRQALFDAITLSERLQIKAYYSVYGWMRDQILASCTAALNFHSQSSRILEWPRLIHLIANRVPCIALLHPQTVHEDGQLSYLLPCSEAMANAQLEAYFAEPEALQSHALLALERFRCERQADYTAATLDQSLAAGWMPARSAASYSWKAAGQDEEVDERWYADVYPWVYHDPRDCALFHRQEGRYRQYHPRQPPLSCFRAPILLPSAPQATVPSDQFCDAGTEPFAESRAEPNRPSEGTAVQSLELGWRRQLRCAVVVHLHMPGIARRFFAWFGRHLCWADFYVTASDPMVAVGVEALAKEYGVERIHVCLIDNRGRDIPSKYMVFNQQLQEYDLCLFSHGKQSDQHWFYDHNNILAGSPQRLQAILSRFAADPGLGLLFPDYLESLLFSIGWGTMRATVDRLLVRFGCDTSSVELLEFPAGGFFWARPQALMVLHSLDLSWDDMPAEPLPVDGTLLHALERMPCLSCEMMGLRWEKIAR